MILLPKPPKIISKKENQARFEIEALYLGYGITIGNALRRVLLSSLPGAAITQMKIKGVQHEFSTIKGVLEDVLTIMMNLKQLRFKMYSDEPQKATLKIKGEKEVKGSDFKFPAQIELVNKSCHVATLTDPKSELEMEIQIEKGIGYEPVERRKKQGKLEIGVIPIDAIFTPIKRVSYKVGNMRVGERTDFDRLYLDVKTDGTITPEEAFFQATEILINHFSLLNETFKVEKPSSASASAKASADKKATEGKEEKEIINKEEEVSEEKEDLMKTKIKDLKLSNRTTNALLGNNIKTLGAIVRKSEKSLLELEGIGEKGMREIKKTFKKLNLELKCVN